MLSVESGFSVGPLTPIKTIQYQNRSSFLQQEGFDKRFLRTLIINRIIILNFVFHSIKDILDINHDNPSS